MPKEHNYRQFRVFSFQNSPKECALAGIITVSINTCFQLWTRSLWIDFLVDWFFLYFLYFQLSAHKRHFFTKVSDSDVISHVRLSIYPDGGVSRLRVWGFPRKLGGRPGGSVHVSKLWWNKDISLVLRTCRPGQRLKLVRSLNDFTKKSVFVGTSCGS